MISNPICGQSLGNSAGALLGGDVKRELGILERGANLAGSLQGLHAKLSNFRDKIEGVGEIKAGTSPATPYGLSPQLTESESILRACHSLMDDIVGKF
jgi:hypothetical protein